MFLDSLPVPRGSGVDGCTLKDSGSDAVKKRTVDDVSVSSDPADISHAGKFVVRMYVKNVFKG